MNKKNSLMKKNLLKSFLFAFIFLILANLVIADDFIRVEGDQPAQPQVQQAPAQQGGIPGAIVIGQSAPTATPKTSQPAQTGYNFLLISFDEPSFNKIKSGLTELKILGLGESLDFDTHVKPYLRFLTRIRGGTRTDLDLTKVKTATIPVNGVQKNFLLIEGVQQNDEYTYIFRLPSHSAVSGQISGQELNQKINSITNTVSAGNIQVVFEDSSRFEGLPTSDKTLYNSLNKIEFTLSDFGERLIQGFAVFRFSDATINEIKDSGVYSNFDQLLSSNNLISTLVNDGKVKIYKISKSINARTGEVIENEVFLRNVVVNFSREQNGAQLSEFFLVPFYISRGQNPDLRVEIDLGGSFIKKIISKTFTSSEPNNFKGRFGDRSTILLEDQYRDLENQLRRGKFNLNEWAIQAKFSSAPHLLDWFNLGDVRLEERLPCPSIIGCTGLAAQSFARALQNYRSDQTLTASTATTAASTTVSASIPIPTTLKAEFDNEAFVFNLDWDVPKGNEDLGFEVEVKVLDDKYSGPNFQVSFLKNEPGLYDSSISGNNTLKVWVALPDAMKLYKSYEFKVRSIRGTSASNYSSPVTVNGP